MRTAKRLALPSSLLAWLWALSLVVAPLLYIIAVSCMSRGEYGGVVPTFSWQAYRELANPALSLSLLSMIGRSVIMALATTVLTIILGFPLALFLVFRAGKWRNLLFFLLIIPFWTNFLIRTYAWQVILSDNGWLNQVLSTLGFEHFRLHWLFTTKAVLIGMVYNYLPYMAMSLYVSLEKLDHLLVDAAKDLGANRWQRFTQLILPLSLPGLMAGAVMVFVPALGEFVIPDVLGGGTHLYIGNYLAQQFLVVRNWPFGAALSVLLVVFIAITLMLTRRFRQTSGSEVLA